MHGWNGIRRAILALAVVAAAGFAPAAAAAQTTGDLPYLDAVDAWADGESLRRLLPGAGATTPSEPGNGGRRPKRPTARQLATLRFKRTAEVTQTSYQAVMDLLEPGYDPAALVAELDRVKSVAHAGMRDLKGRWSPNNIADVAAYMLLSCYGVYHSKPSLPDAGAEAVRRAARNSMALDRRVRRLSDARTQASAEMLELRTILRVSDVNWGRIEHDAAREQAARTELRSWADEAFGIDLDKVKLTRHGLVKR